MVLTTRGDGKSPAGMFPLDTVLDPKKRPLLVQLTTKDYGDLRTRWSLP